MKVGNFVHWRNHPPHLSKFARNQIIEIKGDLARLRFFTDFCKITDLELVEPTSAERTFCDRYHLPISNPPIDDDDW
ncbi:MAG: hypothetical protein KME10_11735 [Plectolyngbya sp. WJT66-NPBG17]|jgi:hypothetical protein|nr:hypothetical protein [Plectolyngbya sp. WJT66-NPBG17]